MVWKQKTLTHFHGYMSLLCGLIFGRSKAGAPYPKMTQTRIRKKLQNLFTPTRPVSSLRDMRLVGVISAWGLIMQCPTLISLLLASSSLFSVQCLYLVNNNNNDNNNTKKKILTELYTQCNTR